MTAEITAPERPRRPWWRFLTQFSLRTLLLLVTAASVACWWYLRPQVREEQYEKTPLRVRRQVRLVKLDPHKVRARPLLEFRVIRGEEYEFISAGYWRLFDQRGHLLVDGQCENDQQHGRWITYHANGRKAAEGRMDRGAKVGLWRTWDEEGRLLSEVTYSAGQTESAAKRN